MSLEPLTDTEREAIVPFLELAERVGIETGWYHPTHNPPGKSDDLDYCICLCDNWHTLARSMGGELRVDRIIEVADRNDYRSLCEAGAEWLNDPDNGSWLIHIHPDRWHNNKMEWWVFQRSQPGIRLDCPDCKLAAITAAIEEVGK